jgi:hypothetical protein
MSRLSDWGIDALDELEDQIEEALEEEYQRGRSEGMMHAEDERGVDLPEEWPDLMREASWAHNQDHSKEWPMRQCSHLLCRLLTQLDEEVR